LDFSISCFSKKVEKGFKTPLFLLYGLKPKPTLMEEAQTPTPLKAHQHVKLGQSLEPWLENFKMIGILLLMAEKPICTCSRRHRF